MVRRTKAEAEATRERLLDAAEQTFCRLGVARATLDDVARAAGVTRGAVYWHFSGKAELFKALCERSAPPLEHLLAEAARRRHDDPLGVIEATLRDGMAAVAGCSHTRAVLDILLSKNEAPPEPNGEQPCIRTTECNVSAGLEQLLKQAVARGQLPRETDTRLAATAITAFISGLARQWLADPSVYDLAEAGPRLVHLMLEGLRAAPPRRAPARRSRRGASMTEAAGSAPGALALQRMRR